ncbi:MAG: hypothetical protein Q7S92_00740 [Candidatus Diapherotrites archaeon]|nr:hypothetical protein [Candidatus Diapherotrites archaeon]
MSDAHLDHGSTGPTPASSSTGSGIEGWVSKLITYVTSQIRTFVAFLFFVFTLGAVLGILIMYKAPQYAGLLVLAPAIMGLLAYYNTTIAVVLFILFGLMISIL